MKISTTTLLLTTAFTACTLASPHPNSNQHLKPIPAVCPAAARLQRYINDLNTHPTQSDIYMAQAQILLVDDELQCPTKNGILDGEQPTSDACRKNQEIKEAVGGLSYSSAEDKRLRLKGLNAACVELDKMIGCPVY